jgi:hypothetical protein
MKSTIVNNMNKKNDDKRTYPYIGTTILNKDKKLYILFHKEGTGTVLFSQNTCYDYDIGYSSNGWEESNFAVLDSGTQVVLQND